MICLCMGRSLKQRDARYRGRRSACRPEQSHGNVGRMDVDILRSGAGALLGFLLAQLVNVAALAYDRFTRARLRIDTSTLQILSHSSEAGNGELYREELYGFAVRNTGRRVATGVEFQLLKIETRRRKDSEFRTVADNTFELAVYNTASAKRGATKVTLVPGSAVLVHLATWREDYWAVMPAVNGIPDYYEETCSDAEEYRFTLAAFGDKGELATAVATLH